VDGIREENRGDETEERRENTMAEQKRIAEEYREFWDSAKTITCQDVYTFPLAGRETIRDRMSCHLISMIEMYSIRYGDPNVRRGVTEFLEKQLFRVPPSEDEVCHLTLDMWRSLKEAILSGEYHKPENGEKE
jgi:hypothetical protein